MAYFEVDITIVMGFQCQNTIPYDVFFCILPDDPEERYDLAPTETAILGKMIARLEEYKKSGVKARYPPDDPRSDPKNFGGTWSPGWC